MKAVGFCEKGLPIQDERALLDLNIPDPAAPSGRDLLVRVHAVSVNPRDMKSRKVFDASPAKPVILGYDASGVVESVGPDSKLYRVGDEVFYSGVLNRQGSNAELQLVDERIVGPKPKTLSHAAAASLPLTMLTAYEMLFDRLHIPIGPHGAGQAVLILGGAGGVPSASIQLARKLTALTVVATASRPESEQWVRDMGAHHVINHTKPLTEQLDEYGLNGKIHYVFSSQTTPGNWSQLAALIAPQGKIGLIDDPELLDIRPLKIKSVSIHWEAMFTRPLFNTPDMIRQHEILKIVSSHVDHGALRATVREDMGTMHAANMRRAHAAIEAGRVIGKLVLSGF